MKSKNIVRCVKTAFGTAKSHFVLMLAWGVFNCCLSVLSVYLINNFFTLVELAVANGGLTAVGYINLAIYFVVLVCIAMYTVYYKRYFVQFVSVTLFEKKIRTTLHEKCTRISNEQFEIPEVDLRLKQAQWASVNIYRLTEVIISICVALFSAISVGGYIVSFNIWYTLFVLFAILPSVITVLYKGKLWKKFYKRMGVLKREEETYSVAICGLSSAKENKINGASDVLLKKWSQTRLRANELENLQSAKIFILKLLLSLATIVGEYGGFVLSVVLLYNNRIGFGEFSATIAAYVVLKDMFKGIFELFGQIGQYSIMVSPYFDFMDLPERGGQSNCQYVFNDSLTLRDVSFSYPNSDKLALKNISLQIKKGEHIAIVGENGAGKTTLLKVILGLYDVTAGTVEYDGVNVKMFAEKDLMLDKSVVQQKYNKYNGMTLADNIFLGSADDGNIDDIKAQLGLEHLDNSLSLGKEFGGSDLSGGEWQKVACARGFVRRFDVIALDEPTSAIDPLREKSLYDAFNKYGSGKTMFIVTHRLGAVRLSDKIVVMKGGKIEGVGSHEMLMKNCDYYKKLWQTQAENYEQY